MRPRCITDGGRDGAAVLGRGHIQARLQKDEATMDRTKGDTARLLGPGGGQLAQQRSNHGMSHVGPVQQAKVPLVIKEPCSTCTLQVIDDLPASHALSPLAGCMRYSRSMTGGGRYRTPSAQTERPQSCRALSRRSGRLHVAALLCSRASLCLRLYVAAKSVRRFGVIELLSVSPPHRLSLLGPPFEPCEGPTLAPPAFHPRQ